MDAETARVLDRRRSAHPLARRRLPAPPSRQPRGEIIREASAQHITQIVVGKSRRSPLRTRFGGSLVEAVLRGTSGIDVHVVADPGADG